jgi:hypothetical protein
MSADAPCHFLAGTAGSGGRNVSRQEFIVHINTSMYGVVMALASYSRLMPGMDEE